MNSYDVPKTSSGFTAFNLRKKLGEAGGPAYHFYKQEGVGDLAFLGEVSQCIVQVYEYFSSAAGSPQHADLFAQDPESLSLWFSSDFEDKTYLVLCNGDKCYGYSARFILKKMRGCVAHSDEKDERYSAEDKDRLFRRFIFPEEGSGVVVKYADTKNILWVMLNASEADIGKYCDQQTSIVTQITIELDIVESLVFNIYNDFLLAGSLDKPSGIKQVIGEKARLSKRDFVGAFGKGVEADKIAQCYDYYRSLMS